MKIKHNSEPFPVKGFRLDITKRKLAEQKLKNAHFQLNNLLHTVEEGLFSKDMINNQYIYISSAFEKIYGYKTKDFFAESNLWYKVILPEDKVIIDKNYERLNMGRKVNFEYRIMQKNKTVRWLNARLIPILDQKGNLVRIDGMVNDNTEKKLFEEALKMSELNYRTLIEQAPDGIFVFNREGSIVDVNTNACKMIGYTQAETRKMLINDIILEEGVSKKTFRFNELKVGSTFSAERKFVRKDASVIVMEVRGTMLPNRLYQVICRDVTERRKNEEELQCSRGELRKLATHLQNIREEERADMAREIHDELGQLLTALRIDITLVRSKLTERDNVINQRINQAVELVDTTIKTVRRIASELRPPVLDEFGLAAAMEWQSKKFTERTGIKCSFVSNNPSVVLAKEISTGLFRVFQESLTNVARHSEATEVDASLRFNNNDVILSVKDNGKGFNAEEIKYKNRLGIIGMKERIKIMDGELVIDSMPGKGTCLVVHISLPIYTNRPVSALLQ